MTVDLRCPHCGRGDHSSNAHTEMEHALAHALGALLARDITEARHWFAVAVSAATRSWAVTP